MSVLFRLLTFAFFIWIVCYFFYSLGKRKALENQRGKSKNEYQRRKVVKSSVVEKGNNSE